VYAASMIALRGETQGLQIVVKGAGTGPLHARVSAASPSLLISSASFLRVGYVNVTKPSTGVSLGRGVYEDPLPRQTAAGLTVGTGSWGGWVALFSVPRSATAGVYQGSIEIVDDNGTVQLTVPIQLKVSTLRMTDPASRSAFKVFAGFRADWYRNTAPVGHDDLRLQFLNAHQFLADHYVAPTAWPFADPSSSGTFNSQAKRQMNTFMKMPWSVRFVPYAVGNFNLRKNYGAKGSKFVKRLNSTWTAQHWKTNFNTIFFTWDEPSAKNERVEIPRINKMIHRNMPGVKTLVTTSPKEGADLGNKSLYNGGSDDIDIWSIPLHRFYGKWTSKTERSRHIDNTLKKWKRIQRVRANHKQIWSNTYLMPTKHVPQTEIDGPPSDPRLIFWWNGLENTDGWLDWQMIRWVKATNEHKKRDPYSDPLSYKTPAGEYGNGDVSLIYPPANSAYGLYDNAAQPVSSIRFETMRLGIQDVNMIRMYRKRFGKAATDRALKGVFGKIQRVSGTGFTWPKYSNTGMSTRLEKLRRTMITKLGG
jgi:hypothetical protein